MDTVTKLYIQDLMIDTENAMDILTVKYLSFWHTRKYHK